MKHGELKIHLEGHPKQFHYIMIYEEKSFTEYFKEITLLQMSWNWYKSLNIPLQADYDRIGH